MPEIKFEHIEKYYSKDNHVVFDFNLEIHDKEFIVLVGPSGCGKSTTLRMVAGLEDITSGELYIDGRLVNDVQAKDRGISMVFQSYALFPNLSVRRNISYGLEIKKVPTIVQKKVYDKEKKAYVLKEVTVYKKMPKDEIKRRVDHAAEILGLTEYLDRKPRALSGGQKQRVALGRTIVCDSKVFLMDEPLSNLDAKLRVQMRKEITDLTKRLGATTIYVTHDQLEAMTMADRIVIMNKGVVQQIGTPEEVYHHPKNKFVEGTINQDSVTFKDGQSFKMTKDLKETLKAHQDETLTFGIRSEDITIKDNGELKGTITMIELLGKDSIIHVSFNDQSLAIYYDEVHEYKVGDVLSFSFNQDRIHVFDQVKKNRLRALLYNFFSVL